MAFSATALQTRAGAPGALLYTYATSSDTMATVLASGYFQNVTYNTNFVAGDLIYCICSDGNMWVKVSSVTASTGAVVVQHAGGQLPIQTFATGSAAGDFGMKVGYYEIGTSVYGTGTRAVLPVPYPGAQVVVVKIDSGTTITHFDAGASASNISWVDGTGGGTAVTFDGTARRMNLVQRGDQFHVIGSSTSRWRIQNYFYHASAVSEGGSVFFLGT